MGNDIYSLDQGQALEEIAPGVIARDIRIDSRRRRVPGVEDPFFYTTATGGAVSGENADAPRYSGHNL